jgi:hypothetical protein
MERVSGISFSFGSFIGGVPLLDVAAAILTFGILDGANRLTGQKRQIFFSFLARWRLNRF